MKVTVKLFSLLREAVANKSTEIELQEGSTVEALVQKMIAAYGSKFQENVWDNNRALYVAVMVNGKAAELNSKLKDGEVVAFLPPAAGGCLKREASDAS